MADKYEGYSPYNYAINNPIIFMDVDGRDIVLGTVSTSFDGHPNPTKHKELAKTYIAADKPLLITVNAKNEIDLTLNTSIQYSSTFGPDGTGRLEKENPGLFREVEAHERGHTEQMLEAAKQDVSLTINLGDKPDVITGRGDVVLTQAMNRWTEKLGAEYAEKRASGEIKKGQKAKDAFYAEGMKGFGKFWDDATSQVTKAIEANIKKEMDKNQEPDANRRAAEKLGEDNIQYNNGRKRITNFGTVLSN